MSRTPALLALALALAAPAARAEPASFVLSHHGRLLDADDLPVEGEQDLVFRIYASPVPLPGESALWDQQYKVRVARGAYAVVLGDETKGKALTTAQLDGATPRYLSVAVGATGAELLPRQRIGAVPFAVNAERLGGLSAGEYLTSAKASADYLAKTDAAATYLAKADATSTYLAKADAEATYAKPAALADFLTKTDAAQTYAKPGDLAPYLKSADAEATYAKAADLGAYVTKTSADTTYAKAADALAKADDLALDRRNLLRNGSFEAWTGTFQNVAVAALPVGWSAHDNGQANVTRTRRTDGAPEGRTYLRFFNPASGGTNPEAYLVQEGLPLEEGKQYTVAFWARGSAASTDKLDVFILGHTAAGAALPNGYVQFFPGSTPLTTTWKRFSYTFTTKADLAQAAYVQLRIDHNGNGTHIDLDGVGIWRGPYAPVFAEGGAPCPVDMADAGDFCVENYGALARNVHWQESNMACRGRGRRLCSADELNFALRGGVIQANNYTTGGNTWIWVRDIHDAAPIGGGALPCHLNMSHNLSGSLLGEVNCQIGMNSNNTDLARLCCASK